MTTITAILPPPPVFRAFDENGAPLAGGQLWSFKSGTDIPISTCADSYGTLNPNPVLLDSEGCAPVYLLEGVSYRLTLKDANGVTQDGYPVDNVQVYGGNQDFYHPEDYGAVGDGVTDDTAALQACFAAVPPRGTIMLKAGSTYKVTCWDLTGKGVTVSGYGSMILCTGDPNGGIRKADHNNKVEILGVRFLGAGPQFFQDSVPADVSYDELTLRDCQFVPSLDYGVRIVGGRESHLESCTWSSEFGGNGLYFKQTVSPFVNNCIFIGATHSGTALWYDGTGTGYDAGLILRDTEIMGWENGLKIKGTEYLVVEGCTIDFNTSSITLGCQNRATFVGNYIGSYGSNWAIFMGGDPEIPYGPTYCDGLVFTGNHFVGHTDLATYTPIYVGEASDNIVFRDNTIAFYTQHGIGFYKPTRLTIVGNTFSQKSGATGAFPVYNNATENDSGVTIMNNTFTTGCTVGDCNLVFATTKNNWGMATDGRGTGTWSATATTVEITHGLAYTPTAKDVQLWGTNAYAGSLAAAYMSSSNATKMIWEVAAAPISDATYAWVAHRSI